MCGLCGMLCVSAVRVFGWVLVNVCMSSSFVSCGFCSRLACFHFYFFGGGGTCA